MDSFCLKVAGPLIEVKTIEQYWTDAGLIYQACIPDVVCGQINRKAFITTLITGQLIGLAVLHI